MATRDEALEIAVGDHSIAATLIVPDTRMPGVLFLHGWGGSQAQSAARAREIAVLGCACLTVDMRGHAKTARTGALQGHRLDLAEARAGGIEKSRGVPADGNRGARQSGPRRSDRVPGR